MIWILAISNSLFPYYLSKDPINGCRVTNKPFKKIFDSTSIGNIKNGQNN